MKHSRTDYAEIQDPSGLIPEEEPVFLLRAQDCVAPWVVRDWADLAEKAGASPDIVSAARGQASAMEHWQKVRGNKIPDMP